MWYLNMSRLDHLSLTMTMCKIERNRHVPYLWWAAAAGSARGESVWPFCARSEQRHEEKHKCEWGMQQRDRYRKQRGGSCMDEGNMWGGETLSNALWERERLTGGQWTIKDWQECLWLLNAKAKGIYSPVSSIYKDWFDLFLSFWKILEPCRLRQNFVFECKFKSLQRWRRDATNLNGTMRSSAERNITMTTGTPINNINYVCWTQEETKQRI